VRILIRAILLGSIYLNYLFDIIITKE